MRTIEIAWIERARRCAICSLHRRRQPNFRGFIAAGSHGWPTVCRGCDLRMRTARRCCTLATSHNAMKTASPAGGSSAHRAGRACICASGARSDACAFEPALTPAAIHAGSGERTRSPRNVILLARRAPCSTTARRGRPSCSSGRLRGLRGTRLSRFESSTPQPPARPFFTRTFTSRNAAAAARRARENPRTSSERARTTRATLELAAADLLEQCSTANFLRRGNSRQKRTTRRYHSDTVTGTLWSSSDARGGREAHVDDGPRAHCWRMALVLHGDTRLRAGSA